MARPGLLVILALALVVTGCGDGLWSTPDQRAQAAFDEGRYDDAAASFRDAGHRGAALYRAGRFEEAAAAFALVPGAVGHYDRGNALVFLGKYAEAIEAYDEAIALRGSFPRAENNRRIARLRLRKSERAAEERFDQGTELGADDIVFEPGNRGRNQDGQETVVEGDTRNADIRALWLRGVEDRPKQFLKVKFAMQNARRSK